MSDQVRMTAFADELVKTAVVGKALTRVGKWVGRGWNDAGITGGGKATWLGKGMGKGKWWQPAGNVTKALPVGEKSLMVGTTALAAPTALSKKDPYGANRSRAERVSGLGGGFLGSLAGAGALMGGPGSKWRTARAIFGGIGGSILGERLSSAPWRRARKAAQRPVISDPKQRAALLRQAQRGS